MTDDSAQQHIAPTHQHLPDSIKLPYLSKLNAHHDSLAYGYLATYKINNQPPTLDNCFLCPLGHLVATLIEQNFPIVPLFTQSPFSQNDYDVRFSYLNQTFDQYLPTELLELIHLPHIHQTKVAHLHDTGAPFHHVYSYIQTHF